MSDICVMSIFAYREIITINEIKLNYVFLLSFIMIVIMSSYICVTTTIFVLE